MDERVRRVDTANLSAEQSEVLSAQIGEKLREIIDQACYEASRIVNIYGIQVKMQFVLEPQEQANTEPKGD